MKGYVIAVLLGLFLASLIVIREINQENKELRNMLATPNGACAG